MIRGAGFASTRLLSRSHLHAAHPAEAARHRGRIPPAGASLADAGARSGVLASVTRIGVPALLALVTLFLAGVAFYCRALQTCLERIRPEARAASPRSVWLMFLIPYNFVEDFFIVRHVATSLRAEAAANPALGRLRGFGTVSGLGWCTAQIISLAPNPAGEAAGAVALVLWVVHWRFIARVNALLADPARRTGGK
jgi:hypothetical protein